MSNVFSTTVLIGDTVNKLNLGLPRTNPDGSRVEDLNQGPPDFKSSELNHSTSLPHRGQKSLAEALNGLEKHEKER